MLPSLNKVFTYLLTYLLTSFVALVPTKAPLVYGLSLTLWNLLNFFLWSYRICIIFWWDCSVRFPPNVPCLVVKCRGVVRNELNGAFLGCARFGDAQQCKGNVKLTNHFLDSLPSRLDLECKREVYGPVEFEMTFKLVFTILS